MLPWICSVIESAPCVPPQGCSCVCWSPFSAEECVAAGYSDGTLRIFRLASSEMEMKLQPHHVTVTAIQYSAYGELSPPSQCFESVNQFFRESIFANAGHVILSAGKDGMVVVSRLVDGAVTRVIDDHRGAPVITIHCVNEKVSSATGVADLCENCHGCTRVFNFNSLSTAMIYRSF